MVTSMLTFMTVFCQDHKGKKHKKDKQENATASDNSPKNSNSAVNCDTSLWKYVYNRKRLEITEICKTVTGVIEESNADEDGDQHMLLKLDKGQKSILTQRNIKKKQGDLVIEAVCINNVSLKKVGNTCKGYVNHIQLPHIGDHVKVTGSLVIDSHNGWAEIHPITSIEKFNLYSPVSPTVVHKILIIQKYSVTSGTLLAILPASLLLKFCI